MQNPGYIVAGVQNCYQEQKLVRLHFMKTIKQPISSASFIACFWTLTLNKLQKKEAIKRTALISFVLLCCLTRYLVITVNKSLEKQNKQATISAENLNLPVRSTGMFLENKTEDKQLNSPLNISAPVFKQPKKNQLFYKVN